MSLDSEHDGFEVHYVKGFPSLAQFIARDYDHSTFILKRFDELTARNLLYFQSELADLQARQDQYDREDFKASWEAKEGRRDWEKFRSRADPKSGSDFSPEDQKRMGLALAIRKKLREYKETIMLDSALLSMPRPSKRTYEAVRNHFHGIKNGSPASEAVSVLQGNSEALYNDRDDLVALVRPPAEDPISSFLRDHCPLLFLDRARTAKSTTNNSSGLVYSSSTRIAVVAAILNILVAAAMLFGPIFNLYYVKDPKKRLSMVAAYTVAFALCVGLLTNASRAEIFAASAGYVAVLVVFVSGDLQS
ncbi:hypothetical protein ASPCAL13520 [Aspergillus calidoustus]|uniref:DUF6594 domain-containing protein n=1 Tax=Aspergillus calidoustus TaxID=454130 RepID=A0A0U5GF60_ASPCI|nr:hypothetical protein ASPCAL13520 [Aspergillus calidoustus]